MAVSNIPVTGEHVDSALNLQMLMESMFSVRNENNKRYTDIFNMIWTMKKDIEGIDNVITTISPSIRNRILGMRRLLDGTEIHIDVDTMDTNFDKDGLERSMRRWLAQSTKIANKRIVSEMALSALLFGEIQIGLDSTKGRIEQVSELRKDRAKQVAEQIPFLPKVWHPNQGRYLTDDYGITNFSREIETTWGAVQSVYGRHLSTEQLGKKATDKCIVLHFWTLDKYMLFVDKTCILAQQHDFKEIPVVVQLVDGSELFDAIEDQRQSVMYAVDKAGYYDQQNSIMTMMASIIFAMGVSPMYKHQLPPGYEDRKLDIDYSKPGAPIHLLPGETYEPLDNRGLVDPALMDLYKRNEMSIEESTIYNTALGAPVESNIAFSTVSLLAQQGRLPLAGPQHAIGDAIGALMELGIRIMGASTGAFEKNGININPKSLPEDLQINASIDIKLPQDKLQLANIAHLLKGDGLVDLEWIQSNILNISDTSKMRKNIILDKLYSLLGDVRINALVQEYQANSAAPNPNVEGGEAGTKPAGTPGQEKPMGGIRGQEGRPSELGMNATAAPETGLTGMPSVEAGVLPSQGRGTVPLIGA